MNQAFVLHRQRSIGELISDSFSITTRNLKPLALMAAPAIIINVLLAALAAAASTEAAGLVNILSLVVQLVVFQLVTAAIAFTLAGMARGEQPNPNAALDAASDKLGQLVSAAARSAVIVVLFAITIVGIPFAIWRLIRWLFTSQVIMLDGQTSASALDFSAGLVKGHWWSTLGRLFVSIVLVMLPIIVPSVVLEMVAPVMFSIVFTALTDIFLMPYSIIATSLIYFDLKELKHKAAAGAAPPPLDDNAQQES